MPKKIICNLSTEELRRAYIDEGRTLQQMCEYVGIKSTITMAKLLNARGISTNANKRLADKAMCGMNDQEFQEYLTKEYAGGKSMVEIATAIGVSPSCVRKYFVKYNISRRSRYSHFMTPNSHPNWNGGRHKCSNGYIEVYMPNHPNANVRNCVYEHQLVMENHIGRYIKEGEVVHHIDGNKTNNKIENLMLMTKNDHIHLHALIKKSKKLMKS